MASAASLKTMSKTFPLIFVVAVRLSTIFSLGIRFGLNPFYVRSCILIRIPIQQLKINSRFAVVPLASIVC